MDNAQQLTPTSPLYMQVAQKLKQGIDDGSYPAGSKLPSESQLVESLSVSRVTVRKALQQLLEIGYIYSEKGKGSFVAHRKLKHDFVSVAGFTEELHDAGMEAQNQVILFETIAASVDVAGKLMIEEGAVVHHCSRLRLVNGQVVACEEFFIPVALLPELNAEAMQHSKFAYLSEHNIEMVKTVQKIRPAMPSVQQQSNLQVAADEPILINESQNYLSETKVYEYSLVYYKSSVYDFEIVAHRKP